MTENRGTDAILSSLNSAQREAVTTIQGPLMTLAGPGSGKTRVVTHRVAYMIDQGISARSILAMTFTNKAAQAIRERTRAMVGDQPITVGTFHGFGARFLRRYGRMLGLEENFSILDAEDSKKVVEEAVIASKVSLSHVTIGDIVRQISELKTKLVTPDAIDNIEQGRLSRILREVYPAYQKRLLSNRAVDFDDLLMHTATILRTEAELRAELDQRYAYVLVDEYQDTNYAQYVIMRALSIDYPNVNVTGDPDQSIYSWRGANIENIFGFERDYPNTKIVRLEQNYRSTPEILSIADTLIQNNRRRKSKNLFPTRPSGSRVRLVQYLSDEKEAEDIADQIKSRIVDEGCKANDFAILYRTNAQSRLLEKALLKRRLNYQLIGGFRFYQRQEIKDLLAYLRLVHNPRDDRAFDRVINTPPRGLGQKTLDKVVELADRDGISRLEALGRAVDYGLLSKKAAASAESFLKTYSHLLTHASGKIVPLLNALLQMTNYLEYLAKQKVHEDDADSFDNNVSELLADANQIDEQMEEGSGLEVFLEQVSLLSETDRMGEEADRVTLMTLHAAKGLEFPSVYIIAIEHDILPHARCREHPEQIEEERRLFFVGLTRARDRLQLSTAAKRGFQHRTSMLSQFLLEIPRLEMDIVDSQHRDEESDIDYDEDAWPRRRAPLKSSRPHSDFRPRAAKATSEEIEVHFETDESRVPIRGSLSRATKANERATPASLANLAGRLKSGALVAPAATLGGSDVRSFHPLSSVQHPEYGLGHVVALDGHGTKRRAKIRFDNGFEQTFILACSPLKLID